MTDHAPPPAPDRRELKADAAAAKARAKASRPLYKKKRFIIPAALLLVVILIVATTGGDDETPTATSDDTADDTVTDQPEASDAPETAGIGEPARDGNFEFTVNGLECGVTEVGDEFTREEPQGQYCLLDLRISNIGEEAGTLFASDQLLLNEEGTQYSADDIATLANSASGDELFSQINPGNAIDGVIVFDVPTDATITAAELHDSAFSGGVEVDVSG